MTSELPALPAPPPVLAWAGSAAVRPPLPELPAPVVLGAGGAELGQLFDVLAMPDRRNDAMEVAGVGGGMEDATPAEKPAKPAPAAPALPAPEFAALAPLANPLTPARAAPATTAPARTMANAVDPASPEMIRLAMSGIRATDSA